MTGDAEFSADGLYRWWLSRHWIGGNGMVAIVGLNPSKAGAVETDPTITREVAFAQSWGYAGLLKLNIFGLVSTDPRGLKLIDDPVGPGNEAAFERWLPQCDIVVCAWGTWGIKMNQDLRAIRWIRSAGHGLHALRVTKDGTYRST